MPKGSVELPKHFERRLYTLLATGRTAMPEETANARRH